MQVKNILRFGLSLLLLSNICFAKDLSKSLDSVIRNSSVQKGGVSVSIKGVKDYGYNSNVLMPPASVQKIVTIFPALDTLGSDYKFSTKLYKNKSEDYLLVLGADPYLESKELKSLAQKMPAEIKSIAIDDSILDDKEWGEGWQWDDALNSLMPKFSSYNMDRNNLTLYVLTTEDGAPARITFEKQYPIMVINKVVTGDKDKIKYSSKNIDGVESLVIEGVVSKAATITIPVQNLKKYYRLRLTDAILDANKSHSGEYLSGRLGDDYVQVGAIEHSIDRAKFDILKGSNNLVSETMFKLAGGKYKNDVGSFENGKLMLEDYYKKLGLDLSMINIVDASGVSKNNLIQAEFLTRFLELKRAELEPMLPTSGEGTLSSRLLYLKGNLRAKTGTLSNVSSLAGYVSTQNGHKYVFAIIINDPKSSAKDKKLLEDEIIKTLYLKG